MNKFNVKQTFPSVLCEVTSLSNLMKSAVELLT